jgi:hypothetical protein
MLPDAPLRMTMNYALLVPGVNYDVRNAGQGIGLKIAGAPWQASRTRCSACRSPISRRGSSSSVRG